MMKNFKIYTLLIFCFISIVGCDSKFEEINTSTVRINELDPIFVFNNAVQACTITEGSLDYDIAIVQQIVTPNGGFVQGGNFNQFNAGNVTYTWDNFYGTGLKHLVDVINTVSEDPEKSNLYNMARILKAYGFMIITDTYGDVPYFDAGKGFLEGIVSPAYDPQNEIYADILNELDEAGAALNSSNYIESGDALLGGDITKWKRFCYSIMLRAAMRVANQDSSMAQTYITKAVTGGLIQSNEDNVIVNNDFSFPNTNGQRLNAQEAANYYMTGEFVDFLADSNDPRLASIAVRFIGATGAGDQNDALAGTSTTVVISTDPADQIGLPMGNDNFTAAALATTLGLASFYDFTQVDRRRMLATDSPTFLVTYAQTQLLLAEAVIRGFTTGDAATLFSNGIRAHMEQLATYGSDTAIDVSDIDTYIANNPLGANALQDINEQYWIASFLHGPETWANFRRSGYPDLSPNPFPNQDITGDFINRLPYPDAELSVNKANMDEALSRQGFSGNSMDGVVWWAR